MVRTFFTAFVLLALSASTEAANLQGKVTRAGTGEAVAGAQILIRGTRFQTASGPDGRFNFLNVPDGTYGVTCAAPGLKGEATGAVALSGTVTRDFALSPPEAQTFAATGAASCGGNPCGGVLVAATRRTNVLGIGLSAPDGSFAVEGLASGGYDLTGVAFGHLPATVQVDVSESTPPAALNLTPAPGGFTVRGRVGLSDNPLDRSGSSVRCNGQVPDVATSTIIGGTYTLPGVPAGPMSLTASRAGFGSSTQIDVLVAYDLALDFVLTNGGDQPSDPTYDLTGTVALDVPEGKEVPAGITRVSLWSPGADLHQTAAADGNGAYRIDRLPPGAYQAGAAREGFLPQLVEPFEISGNTTRDFRLLLDPSYDWGPGENAADFGCGCTSGADGSLLALAFLWALWRGCRPAGHRRLD